MRSFLFILLIACAIQSFADSKVLVFSQENEEFNKLNEYLNKELGPKYKTKVITIDKSLNQEKFETYIKENSPNLLILMDNQAVSLAKNYYLKKPHHPLPSVALMGLNYKTILKGNPHICGIAYEVSAFSVLTQFRNLRSDKKLKTVLTFYRASQFEETIQDAKELLKLEKIDLVAIDIDKKENVSAYLKTEGLREIKSKKYDAVYVLLDSVLLEKSIFSNFWRPAANESKVPFLIGAEKFVHPNFNFAVFGISPDLKDMASQAAQMVEGLLEGQKCQKIEDPVGVQKYWNLQKGEELGLKIDENSKTDLILSP